MYDNKIHSVEHCIVSLSQLWICQIVRKTKAPIEFGAKLDLSIDNDGYSRIEKILFKVYKESTCLIETVECFKERTGWYLESMLANQTVLAIPLKRKKNELGYTPYDHWYW